MSPLPAPHAWGREVFTDRQREVLQRGMTARSIGERLGISQRTVAFHK